MTEVGLHVERTDLAWVRTWLAATTGSAVALRVVIHHHLLWFTMVLVACAVSMVIVLFGRRQAMVRGAALVGLVICVGLATAVSAVLRLIP